ncbi:hypothetical protein DFH07DRAFT_936905 [Mycena maculata]|uniref:Uncharacterized protein n=1 Tax=Mycena maculata TaxID=230809 RepID=A0AAD7NVD3_9AGAR|nr:hypothetical protein DFH07DRAFT_936905 [Mycena maculata]
MLASTWLSPTRVPVPRSFTAPATPVTTNDFKPPSPPTSVRPCNSESGYSDEERTAEALSLRLQCPTPTFSQSSKLSHMASGHVQNPVSPMMHRGQGIGNLRQYTDYGTMLVNDAATPAPGFSGLLRRNSSRFRLKLRPSKCSLRSADESSEGGDSNPGPPLPTGKPLPLPPLFSPCTSPIGESDDDAVPSSMADVPRPAHPKFKIRRKPVPQYHPTPDSDSSSDYGSDESSEPEQSSALQNVGPNVFIAYDDDSSFTLAAAFTHVIRLVPADAVGTGILRATPSEVTLETTTGVHTLRLPIPPPAAQPGIPDSVSVSKLSSINVRSTFVPSSVPRQAVLGFASPSDPDPPSVSGEDTRHPSDLLPCANFSYADLVATQEFLAASGRIVSLQELAYFLIDVSTPSDAPPLGLQASQIDTALAFLRPHPFAAGARLRVLVMTPRGQLAVEGLALLACYLARAERCSVRSALLKFEGSVGTVSRPWRGLLGPDEVIATYLEELLAEDSKCNAPGPASPY